MEHYALIIDKEKAQVLQAMVNLAAETTGFMHYLSDEGLSNAFIELIEVNTNRTHEKGWCADPNCDEKAEALS